MALKKIISIDIGSNKIKFAAGKYSKDSVQIEKLFAIETPNGSLSDGKLIFTDANEDILKHQIKKALSDNRIKYKDAIFTIQSSSVIRRELDMPKVKPHDMESMIRFEIEQYLPIDLNEYIIEYKMLDEKNNDKLRIHIAALPKAIAESYLNAAKAMKLEARALDINSNAVSKLFCFKQLINGAPYNLDNTAAFIDMGYSNIGITILSKGKFQFSRLVPTGGNELTSAVSEAFNISLQEAERKKISEANLSISEESASNSALNEVIRKIVSNWADDIMRVFQYYNTRNSSNNIHEIYLHGGVSNLKGVAEFIQSVTNLPTRQIKTLSSVIQKKNADIKSLELYLNTLGAIIRK